MRPDVPRASPACYPASANYWGIGMNDDAPVEAVIDEADAQALRKALVLDSQLDRMLRRAKKTPEGVHVVGPPKDLLALSEAIAAKLDKEDRRLDALARADEEICAALRRYRVEHDPKFVEELAARLDEKFGAMDDPVTTDPVDRSVVILRPKQPFVDWTLTLPDPLVRTLEEWREDRRVYLIPLYATDDEAREWIDLNFDFFFNDALWNWHEDEALFPAGRTAAMFHEWFDVEIHSEVVDVVDNVLEKEPG